MDNQSTLPPDVVQMFIQEVRESNVEIYAFLAGLTAIVYNTALSFGDELELMWMKRPNIPSILYFCARYGAILAFVSTITGDFLSPTASISTCSIFVNLANSLAVVAYFGIQGLLAARAYSLSQSSRGKWFVILSLSSLCLSGVVLSIAISAAFPGCLVASEESVIIQRVNLAIGCLTIVTDSVVFAVTVYQVWGTWTLQRELKQGANGSIVSLLLKQGIWRYCFVLSFTLASAVVSSGIITNTLFTAFTFLQQSLSAILICEFSLELRRRNKPKIEQTLGIETLSWSFQNAPNILRREHDTMITELGGLDTASVDSLEMDILDTGSPDTEMAQAGRQTDLEAAIVLNPEAMPATTQLSPGEFPWAVPEIKVLPSPSDPSPSGSGLIR